MGTRQWASLWGAGGMEEEKRAPGARHPKGLWAGGGGHWRQEMVPPAGV